MASDMWLRITEIASKEKTRCRHLTAQSFLQTGQHTPRPMLHQLWSIDWNGKQLNGSTIGNRKEGNVLFNDALNTFYLQLYGVRHMVKDHSNSERGNPLPPHGLLFPISSKVLLYASSHRQDNTYHGLCSYVVSM